MALPGNVTTLVVRGTYLTPEGQPSTGSVTFTPSRWLNNSGADIAIPNSTVTATLGTAGEFELTLPVTDDLDLQPANWFYTVTELVDGVSQSYDLLLPGTAGAGGTVYLADLAPAVELGPEYASIQGPQGLAATVTVGTVGSTAFPGPGTVTNSGTTGAAVLDFVLVTGEKGDTGDTGPIGPQGSAATIEVGTVTTGTAGGTASVSNTGTTGSAVLDFVIPRGDKGDTGDTGPAATIAIGSVSTVAFGGTAAVTNVGSSTAGTFDFTLVTGPQGDLAGLSANAPIDYTANTFSLNVGDGLQVVGTALEVDFSTASAANLGAAAAGTAVVSARGDHVHAMPSATDVGAVGTATAITAGTGLTGGGDLSTSRTLNADLSASAPASLGTATAGTATTIARADHVHPTTGLVTNSLISAKGALISGSGASTPAALSVGTDGHILTADSTETLGIKWAAAPASGIAETLLDAKGDLIVASAADTAARLAVGTNGHALLADSGATNGVKWGAVGKVLQVVTTTKTDTFSTTSTSATAVTGLSVSITPTAATSKVLVLCFASVGDVDSTNGFYLYLRRGGSDILIGNAGAANQRRVSAGGITRSGNYLEAVTISYLDSPASTSAQTYQLFMSTDGSAGSVHLNRSHTDGNNSYHGRAASTITVLEIGA
jgi:hypothetical protein